jgi:hypothetical protein
MLARNTHLRTDESQSQPVTRGRALLALWSVAIVVGPFYLFGSGQPQIDDYVIAVLFVATVLVHGAAIKGEFRQPLRMLGWFVLYVVVVNVTWSVVRGEWQIARISRFYLFNVAAFALFLILYRVARVTALRVTMHALAASLFCQAVLSSVFPARGLRAMVFFNSPNQLAYSAIGAGCLFFAGAVYLRPSRMYQALVLLSVLYLAAISLSKAGIGAAVILAVVVILRRPAVPLLVGVCVVLANFATGMGDDLLAKVQTRFGSNDRSDTIAGRGYDRIGNHPEYLILGAGEGEPERFETVLERHEMHSTLGTILFSYGILGFGLFCGFIATVWRRVGSTLFMYSLPLFAYGMTHQGLRLTLFWLFFAYILCLQSAAAAEAGRLPAVRRRERARAWAYGVGDRTSADRAVEGSGRWVEGR